MPSSSPRPRVNPSDRLALTTFFALVAHAIVILGVGFSPDDKPRTSTSTLEIILVPSKTKKAPDDAQYLAQANQDGGGESVDKVRPTTPVPRPVMTRQAEIPAAAPPVQPAPAQAQHQPTVKAVLTREKATVQAPPKPVRKADQKPARKPRPEPPAKPRVSAAELVTQSRDMQSLNAELNRQLQAYAERPRRKYINARTREYKYAAYMEAWRAKVERVGNLNYPDDARRRNLSGGLLLDVSLNPDGSINEIILRRSSGHKILDDAAMRIVQLAAPFAPFPKNIAQETDILHIERTWQFLGSNEVFAR